MHERTPLRELAELPEDLVRRLAEYWVEAAEDVLALAAMPATRTALLDVSGTDETGFLRLLATCRDVAGPQTSPAVAAPSRRRRLGGTPDSIPERESVPADTDGFPAPPILPVATGDGIPTQHTLLAEMPPVRDGGERATGTAFALAAAAQYLAGDGTELAAEFLHFLQGGDDRNVADLAQAAADLNQFGICPETRWPYGSKGIPAAAAWEAARHYATGGIVPIPDGVPETCLTIVGLLLGFASAARTHVGRPVPIQVPVYGSWWSAETESTGRIYRRLGGEPPLGIHALCVVGYRLDASVPGGGLFIARNSWGTDWAAESPVAPGHALVPFRYVEEALGKGFAATALFTVAETVGRGGLPMMADRYVEHAFAAAQRMVLAQLGEEEGQAENVRETICEREYDERQTLRRERFTDRRVWRRTLRHTSLSLAPDDNRFVAGQAAAAWAHRQLRGSLLAFASGHNSIGELSRIAEALVPPEQWPHCYLPDEPAVVELCHQGAIAFSRPFAHLPVLEMTLPPVEGLAAVFEERFGLSCVLPETPFRAIVPTMAAGREIHAPDWLQVPKEARAALGSDVRVGLLDTGLDRSHPDLARVASDHCRDFTGDGPEDWQGHGSHCAGILAGRGSTEGGGVAPRAELFMGKVFDSSGNASLAAILGGLDWLVESGVQVLSLSLGSSDSPNGEGMLTKACEFLVAEYHRLVCVAAGNVGPGLRTITSPGDARGVVTVAALDADRQLADFSSRGSDRKDDRTYGMPDVGGPGVNVVAPRASRCLFPPWRGDSRYAVLSGTSMACPAIAGLCALLWSACGQGTERERRERTLAALYGSCEIPLSRTGRPYRSDCEVGHGIPDAPKALALLGWTPGGQVAATAPAEIPAPPARCSWLGIPLDPSWTLGNQYLACANKDCRSRPEERWLSRQGWERFHAEAAERQWCRNCLERERLNGTAIRTLDAAASRDLANRLGQRLAKLRQSKCPSPLHLPDSGAYTLQADGETQTDGVLLPPEPFPARSGEHGTHRLIWSRITLRPTRQGFLKALRRWPTRSLVLGILGGDPASLDQARAFLEEATPCRPAARPLAWRQADVRVLIVAVDWAVPVERHPGGFLVPLALNGHWHPPCRWPEGDAAELAGLLALETAEEQLERALCLVLGAAARRLVERPGSEAVISPSPELAEFWNPAWIDRLSTLLDGALKPVTDRRGQLQAVRLENAHHWLPTTDRQRQLQPAREYAPMAHVHRQ